MSRITTLQDRHRAQGKCDALVGAVCLQPGIRRRDAFRINPYRCQRRATHGRFCWQHAPDRVQPENRGTHQGEHARKAEAT